METFNSTRNKLFVLQWKGFPKFILLAVLSLGFISVLNLYSADSGSWFPWALPHLIKFVFAIILMFVVASIDLNFIYKFSYYFYVFVIFLLLIVYFFGASGLGAQRWINLGFMSIQPSELMKLAMVLFVATYFDSIKYGKQLHWYYLIIPLISLIVPFILIFLEPDFGTAFLLGITVISMLFVAGINLWYFLLSALTLVISAPFIWMFILKGYQQLRILTFLGINRNSAGAGYHILQSKISIGSGGLFGKGFLQGSQGQLNFLPEKQTDFAFTFLGEEFGFVGALVVLFLFLLIIMESIWIASKCQRVYYKLLVIGVISLLTWHVFVNVGMVLSILPVVGIPLPIISYGGTSMMVVMIGLGLIINVGSKTHTSFTG